MYGCYITVRIVGVDNTIKLKKRLQLNHPPQIGWTLVDYFGIYQVEKVIYDMDTNQIDIEVTSQIPMRKGFSETIVDMKEEGWSEW